MMVLALLVIFLMPALVQAQGEVRLSSVSVDIWPEYDQPAVLVIYHITLAPDAALPATLTLRVPAGVQVNAVAVVDPVKGLLNALYERVVQEEWAVLTISANLPQVQIEYYEALVKNGTARHIVFKWAGDYAVDILEANFLLPLGAENVIFNPVPVKTGPGQDGLTNYRDQTTHLMIGQIYTLTIDYQRQTDNVSISGLPVQAASPPGADTPGRVSMTGVLPWVLAGIGALLIVAGVIGFVVWQRGGRGSAVRQRQAPRRGERATESIYCQQCGKRAQPGDVFCRTCGMHLRREPAE
jgi:hypothetical protein